MLAGRCKLDAGRKVAVDDARLVCGRETGCDVVLPREDERENEREERTLSWLNKRSPATENVPMIRIRINQTIMATKTGTTLVMVALLSTEPAPWLLWLMMAIDTPHQVREAFIAAASNQAGRSRRESGFHSAFRRDTARSFC